MFVYIYIISSATIPMNREQQAIHLSYSGFKPSILRFSCGDEHCGRMQGAKVQLQLGFRLKSGIFVGNIQDIFVKVQWTIDIYWLIPYDCH